MERNVKKCTAMETKLADMLLAPSDVPAKVKTHVAECESCSQELQQLRATMALLDTWDAPEPSPYFLTRLDARLREERRAAPAGWFERLRARLVYGPHMHVRPLAAMALTVVLLLGGGTYLGVTNWDQPAAAPPQAAVVHDLQLLDNNAQLLDQLETLSSSDNTEN
jgi:hypothetical protein